jgi:alpha-tubulin suppressor-like RCC1 family protein
LALVASASPRFSRPLGPVAVRAGSQAILNPGVVGTCPLRLQWYHDGVAILGATNRYLQVAYAQTATAGNYVLVASNAMGLASSPTMSLTVQPDPITVTSVGAWGNDLDGQCDVSLAATTPRAIAAGPYHSLAVNADGTVAAWGKNWDGQTSVPPTATNVVAVAAGGGHSLALRNDGSVVAWGRNWDGQTNVPPLATNTVSVAAGLAHSLALRADGTVLVWGSNEYGQTNTPPAATGLVAIAAGYYHNLALRSDHTIIAWGLENTVPTSATSVVAIAGGWWHSLALRADGSVVAWGDNSYDQCTVPASATNVVGIAAGYAHNLALCADGTIITWGKGAWGVTNLPTGLRNVTGIAAGQDYSVAMVEMGPPRFDSAPASVLTHVGGQAILSASVGGTHPLSLQWFHDALIAGATNRWLVLTNTQLADAGSYTLIATNGAGQTNAQNATLTVQPGPAIAEVLTPQNVLVGSPVSLLANASGAEPLSYQWRLNGRDLADDARISGTTSKTLRLAAARNEDSGSYSLVASNASGSATGTVAQISVSSVLAWGDNSAGQSAVPVGTADVVTLAAGGDHSLALRLDGTVVAWGDNTYGQTTVPASAQNVVAIAAGGFHSLALLLDGTVLAWGSNSGGQRTVPASATNVLAIAAGDDYSLALQADGTLVLWGNLLPPPATATNVVAIAAGAKHALALRADGTLIAWGANYYGQTAVPSPATNVIGIAAGGDHSLALLADGTVACWGANYYGQASVPPSATNILAISAGGAHSLALVGNGTQRPVLQPLGRAANIGQPTVLSAGSPGGALANYQWQLNGMDLPGATTAALTIGFVTWTNAGLYRVIMSNALGYVVGPPIILTVLRTPLQFDTSLGWLQMTNGGFHLRLLGASGVGPVVIYASSNFLAWQPIFTNPAVIGPLEFTDAGISSEPGRFYRATEGEAPGPLWIELATTPAQAGTGKFPLRLTGLTAEGPVVIYASSNLVDWQAVFTNPPTIGPLQYLEGSSTVQPQRFYRASETRQP